MKHVELIRGRILRGLAGELTRLRIFISSTDGNQEVIDRLRGQAGEIVLAKMTDLLMSEMGHETDTPVEAPASRVRRAINRVR